MYQLVSCHLGLLNKYTASICEFKFERAPKVLFQSSSQILPFSSTLVMIAYTEKSVKKISNFKAVCSEVGFSLFHESDEIVKKLSSKNWEIISNFRGLLRIS